ncbi:MAG: S1 family peptidase [Sandaracinaceae bacterium]|nr:S1 family peptidase [Sandaracinaceae bacterium]
MCTATLVRPNVALTAAHCVHFLKGNATDWTLELNDQPSLRSRCALSFTTGSLDTSTARWQPDLQDRDIALVQLSSPARGSTLRMSVGRPSGAEQVEVVGAGCRNHGRGAGIRFVASGEWGAMSSADLVCDGDSGGPVVRNGDAIAGIAVSYVDRAASRYVWIDGALSAVADRLQAAATCPNAP